MFLDIETRCPVLQSSPFAQRGYHEDSYADSGVWLRGRKSQGDKKWDCFSSCSSCWTNGWGGGVAGAIPGSQVALTWPLQLVVGKQSDIFSTHSKKPTAKPLLVPPSWPGFTQGWWEHWKKPKEDKTCHMPTRGRTLEPRGKEHHDWQAGLAHIL